MRPGLGFGGSCLPKDVRSLIAMGIEYGQTMSVAKAVDEANREQPVRYARALAQLRREHHPLRRDAERPLEDVDHLAGPDRAMAADVYRQRILVCVEQSDEGVDHVVDLGVVALREAACEELDRFAPEHPAGEGVDRQVRSLPRPVD